MVTFRHSIGLKLVTLFLVIALLPLITMVVSSNLYLTDLGDYAESESSTALQAQIDQQLRNEVLARAEETQNFVDEREADAATLTGLHALDRYLTARDGEDPVGVTMGQQQITNGVEGWGQSLTNFFDEREADMSTLAGLDVLDTYFGAERGEVETLKVQSQEQLGHISLSIHDTLETLHHEGYNASEAEAIIAGTAGDSVTANGTLSEVFTPGYIGASGYVFVLTEELLEEIHIVLPDGANATDYVPTMTELREVCLSDNAVRNGEDYAVFEYTWSDPTKEGAIMDKFISYTLFEPYGWIICSSTYYYELMEQAMVDARYDIGEAFINYQSTRVIELKGRGAEDGSAASGTAGAGERTELYPQLLLTDDQGRALVTTVNGERVTDPSVNHTQASWYRAAARLEEGEVAFGSIMQTQYNATAFESMHISAPVYFHDTFMGVVTMALDYSVVSRMIEPVVYGASGYLFFVNASGIVVSHPEYGVEDAFDITDPADAGPSLAAIAADEMLTGAEGITQYRFEGEERYIAYSPVPVGNRTFVLAATVPVDELNALALDHSQNALEEGFVSFLRNKMLRFNNRTYDLYHSIIFADEDGTELAAAEEGAVSTDAGRDHASNAWFTEARALTAGSVYFGPVKQNADGEDMIRLAAPVYHSGSFSGAVALNLHYFIISDLISGVTLGESGYLSIVNEDGYYVSHPGYSVEDQFDITDPDNSASLAQFATETMLVSESGSGEYRRDKETVWVAFAALEFGSHRYTIAAALPASEALRPAHALGDDLSERTRGAYQFNLLIAIIAAVIVSIVGYLASRTLSKPIREVTDHARRIADGDLSSTIEVKRRDEIGELGQTFNSMARELKAIIDDIARVATELADGNLATEFAVETRGDFNRIKEANNRMIRALRGLVKQVKEVAQSLGSTAEELASSSEEMNASSEEVSSAIQQISEGAQTEAQQVSSAVQFMRDMSQNVEDVADRSQSATHSAKEASSNVDRGRTAVTGTIEKMKEIQGVVNDSAAVIETLGERSAEINQIVDVITGVTDQTNLLALNAAIEAARAGEHGRGFAVVAEEVKNLAEDSKNAAEQIAGMIADIQHETARAVSAMRRGTDEVDAGIATVTETDEAFQTIARKTEETTTAVTAISNAASRQREGANEAVRSIDSIASISEETASAAEESASATEELTAGMEEMTARSQQLYRLAQQLQKRADRFRLKSELKRPKLVRRTAPSAPSTHATENTSGAQRGRTPRTRGGTRNDGGPKLPAKVRSSLERRGIDFDDKD